MINYNQIAFNTILRHLRIQGKQSLRGLSSCAYRGWGGAKCAIGCLIPDSMYTVEMEGAAVGCNVYVNDNALLEAVIASDNLLSNVDLSLLYEMQLIHDQYHLLVDGTWQRHINYEFKKLSQKWKLQYKEP